MYLYHSFNYLAVYIDFESMYKYLMGLELPLHFFFKLFLDNCACVSFHINLISVIP